ncbi:UDP-N-acetylmuramoylalanyl-D-glutamate--2,6-diaminopimelate ligase [Austwickia chelonae]|uniref:UDP-N-acetylmuramoyl-L-alanyl-D-glutamate--2,6-diaminopimelate ligase n=1 Tax=Austwickia chelonae NBRC 105200 TaxID=1184607 RepID=K6V380_9MICO|nr:UDP-N-acetylmuramoyl-L-alanyl-D-glutamate--2,6-diaminopimelate ligase [Austwickia chelonae]GAB76483.1 UDP-N-acetylmuramoyl-L-alanyl-D-glutamate--2,6-diaminopimelate ligase [Austwickia chelonae NBRC 105200]SEW25504.1 UDP-N-acetylmuramoylalanyl-D-glutamate--2,6-diaminopimelate ligase [Austwickia chelonae]
MSSTLRPTKVPQVSVRRLAREVGAELTLAGGLPSPDVGACGIVLDSRRVTVGDIYAGLPGEHVHGASFAGQAAASGAVAVLTDPEGQALMDAAGVELPRIVVPSPRDLLGALSALMYDRPADALTLVGVTGTNGKTTTAYIVDSALRAMGRRTGLIGTIETRVGERSVSSVRTTPESCDLHALFALMREEDVDSCVMEVSSHALELHRVDGAVFDVAIFTNMSQDHLDFHGSMETYFKAKASLFTPERARLGVVCVDDAWGARLAREASIPVVTVATRADAVGDAHWTLVPEPERGVDAFSLVGPDETFHLKGALPGDYNQSNTAFVAVALSSTGLSRTQVETALADGARVPGRMEPVDLGAEAPSVYVDFAHTPEAVRATLATLKKNTRGRLIAVIGAGGHRDSSKRPLMGGAAMEYADLVVVTDDNPRDEDPAVIREAIAVGARACWVENRPGAAEDSAPIRNVAERAEGIAEALRCAGPQDVVAVLGRGHEKKQEIMGEFVPFDDRVAVESAWSEVAHP